MTDKARELQNSIMSVSAVRLEEMMEDLGASSLSA